MTGSLLLFDDRAARAWHPFSLTRPVGELPFGACTLRERIERALDLSASAYLPTPGLEGFEEPGAPQARRPDTPPREGAWIVLSSRYVPPFEGLGYVVSKGVDELEARGLRLSVSGGATAGWLLPPPGPLPSTATLLEASSPGDPAKGEARGTLELPGRLLESPWQLLSETFDQLAADLAHGLVPGSEKGDPLSPPDGVHVLGNHPVTSADGAIVDPNTVLDARGGPIHLARDVRVRPFTDLRGPAYVGPGSVLMGGVFDRVVVGPVSKVRGEISDSVILGYSNKAHDGYLGHSILGRWVNLGALTTNSDLKNNYGPIRVGWGGGTSETGLLKFGVLLGDHVKTGIGTLLGAGTVVGAGTNLFGGGMPAKWVPPFHWGSASGLEPHRMEAFLETAERAMGRRGLDLTTGQRKFLSQAWSSVHEAGRASGG